MLNNLKKFSLFAFSFLSLVAVLCLYALPISAGNFTTITYLNSYGQMSVVINTKSGQSAVIGENNILTRYKSTYNVRGLDMYFSYHNLSDEEASDLNQMGINKFISCQPSTDEGGGNCEFASFNNFYSIGDVNFAYLTYYDNEKEKDVRCHWASKVWHS